MSWHCLAAIQGQGGRTEKVGWERVCGPERDKGVDMERDEERELAGGMEAPLWRTTGSAALLCCMLAWYAGHAMALDLSLTHTQLN